MQRPIAQRLTPVLAAAPAVSFLAPAAASARDEYEHRIRRGFEITPASLNLRGRDGLGIPHAEPGQ